MLVAEAVSLRIGPVVLLDGADFEAEPGRLTVIIGPNGAGKSTLLSCLTGERRPDRGSVRLDGRDICSFTPAALAARRAVLPQSSNLSFPFTVGDVVGIGLDRRLASGPRPDDDILRLALQRVGLAGYERRLYQTLSGGERQRAHFARVLAQVWEPEVDGAPRYLMLDEPTASLDLKHQIDILDIARDYARAGGGVIAVLHDIDLAQVFADRIVVMKEGRVAAAGPAASVVTEALLKSVYQLDDRMIALKRLSA